MQPFGGGESEDLVLVGIHAPQNHTFWGYSYKKRRTKLKGIKVLCRPCRPLVKHKEEYKQLKKAVKKLNIML